MKKKLGFEKRHFYLLIFMIFIIIVFNFISYFIIKDDLKPEVKQCEENKNYNIRYNGYLFKIPNEMNHEIYNGNLILSDKKNTWNSIVNIVDKSYEILYKEEKKYIKSLEEKGIKVVSSNEKTYSGTTYLTLEINSEEKKGLLVFSNLSSSSCIMIIITDDDNRYNYNSLNSLSTIIKNTSYYGEKASRITSLFNEKDIKEAL